MQEPKRRTNSTRKRRKRRLRPLGWLLLGAAALLAAGAVALVVFLVRGSGAPPAEESDGATQSTSGTGTTAATGPAADTADGTWVVEGEQAYYLGGDGSPYTGVHTIDGAECTFADDGSLLDGWANVDNIRYHFSGGVLSKGTQVIDGLTRYINADGTMFVGWYDSPFSGQRYYYDYETGASYRGWKEIDGSAYYFQPDGTLARSTTVDGVAIDDDGVAAELPASTSTSGSESTATTRPPVKPDPTVPDSLGRELDDILATYGDTPEAIYDYVHDHYTYRYAPEGSIAENAQHMLDYGTGSCYNFASLTYLLFQRAGYDVYYVTGKGWQPGDYHCWCLAYFDGGWYYVDSLYVRSAKLTAAELREKGYVWDQSGLPG
ncbi:MAG TPA: hypothetical protein H9684_08685 [Firmicutes bacterium]|nr:hypothetical protein [Bacillota bacterium]